MDRYVIMKTDHDYIYFIKSEVKTYDTMKPPSGTGYRWLEGGEGGSGQLKEDEVGVQTA